MLRTVEERGVKFIRLWFIDVLGLLKSISIPVSELESALEDGVGLDGSSLEGAARLREHDVIAHPDPRTFQVLPWRPDSIVARMFCDVRQPDDGPFGGDSRATLRRVLEQAAALGYTMQVGCEVEFFIFAPLGANGAKPTTLDDGAYFDLTPLDVGSDFRRRTIDYLEQMGIPVKASHHEVAPSQHEIQLAHTDALSMADAVTTFRIAVKEAAHELGAYATFMPKPLAEYPGSGMHLHISLFQGERNAFHDPEPRRAAVADRARVPCRRARPRRRADRGDEPVDQLLPAPGDRLRGARVRQLDAARGGGARPRARRVARAARRARASSCARPTPPATRTWCSRSCSPPACAGSSAATSCRPSRSTTTRAAPRACRSTCARRPTCSTRRSSRARRSATACATSFVANKRRELDDERRSVTEFDRSRYLRLL